MEVSTNIKVLQWNIGGGKIRDINDDPEKTVGAKKNSYSKDDLDYVIDKIREYSPDIITLVEVHANETIRQVEVIAKTLGYGYWVEDEYCDSHVEKGQRLCQSIISKFPLSNHSFKFFYNPKLKKVMENGETWIMVDKGRTFASASLPDGTNIGLTVLHMIPFRRFDLDYDSLEGKKVLEDVSKKVFDTEEHFHVVSGDFNIDTPDVSSFFSDAGKFNELISAESTTPKGRNYDHILSKGLQPINRKVDSTALTDHYPVVSEFKL
ncbi:MAG: endonuclease/exonuclease/phosphatase family protein [Candidatus Paceibacterota bacterium]|jgi:hypothetical protein